MQCANLADFAEVKHLQKKKSALFRSAQDATYTGTVGYGLCEGNNLFCLEGSQCVPFVLARREQKVQITNFIFS